MVMNKKKPLGIIAGSGDFPEYICREAEKQGYFCFVAAIKGEAKGQLSCPAGEIKWFEFTKAAEIVPYFKSHGVEEAVFAGKFDPGIVYRHQSLGSTVLKVIAAGSGRSPSELITLAINYFSRKGIQILDIDRFISPAYCRAGVMSRAKPNRAVAADMEFGWNIARIIADLDIGQAVVVKRKAVIAVEGIEGTDSAVRRAGELAGSGTVVVKVCRTNQDSRVDLPAVGLETIRSMVEAGAAGLCFEAERMPFFQQQEALALADMHRIVIKAKRAE